VKTQKIRLVLGALFLSLFAANTISAIEIRTDYDRAANFGQYKTYCWQKVETRDPLWIDRIKAAVNSELAAKGWTETRSGSGCDAAIVAMDVDRNHQTLNTFYDNFGGGWGWRGFGVGGFGEATTSTDTYRTGTLVVDIFDARSKNLIWRGSATDTLSNKSEKNIKNLDKGVEKLFQHFPPEPKS
jgi:Domain of unknown function (DUF4136)